MLSRLIQAQLLSTIKSKVEQNNEFDKHQTNAISDLNPMTDQQIRDNVITMLIAGHETTSMQLHGHIISYPNIRR
ncbi:MAG: cytochrome P450 [Nitrosopumilus sp.]|nr:cytochrome P450 [Nitrosopumilus sp.]